MPGESLIVDEPEGECGECLRDTVYKFLTHTYRNRSFLGALHPDRLA